jgi:hypothetical protein
MTLMGGVSHMSKNKTKTTTIGEIEKVVNRLLRSHESSFKSWMDERLENSPYESRDSLRSVKKQSEKVAHA